MSLNQVKNILVSRTQILLPKQKQMFPSLATLEEAMFQPQRSLEEHPAVYIVMI